MTTQINQLTELTSTSDGDLLLIRENATGVDKKMQASNLRAKATTKDDVGLGDVDNVSAANLRDRSTHTGTQPLSTISDAGNMGLQNKESVNIDGGTIDGTAVNATNLAYTGTLTGGTGVVNLGSGQVFKDANGNVGVGTSSPGASVHIVGKGTGSLLIDGTDSIRPSTDDSLITISGGVATNSGANYSSFGGTHPTLANTHRWRIGSNEAMRIDSSGHAIIPAGVTLGTSAGVFNAANTLNDYEEGVHTVSITTSSGSVTIASDGNEMAYTKVGRIVFVTARLRIDSVSSPTGAIIFTLPFVPAADSGGAINPFSCAANIRIDNTVSKNYLDFVGGIFGSGMRAFIGDVGVISSGGANAQQLQENSLIDIQAHYFV